MILDVLENAERYCAVHPRLAAAFDFLREADTAGLAPGRRDLDGDRLYAMIVRDQGRGRQRARLEAHREYIDVQFSVEGTDLIGWKSLGACAGTEGYDAEKDLEFFSDKPDAWIATPPGTFAIFFPEDAHAPMAAEVALHKVIVKVAVEHPGQR